MGSGGPIPHDLGYYTFWTLIAIFFGGGLLVHLYLTWRAVVILTDIWRFLCG